jgi:hypothetical protein
MIPCAGGRRCCENAEQQNTGKGRGILPQTSRSGGLLVTIAGGNKRIMVLLLLLLLL